MSNEQQQYIKNWKGELVAVSNHEEEDRGDATNQQTSTRRRESEPREHREKSRGDPREKRELGNESQTTTDAEKSHRRGSHYSRKRRHSSPRSKDYHRSRSRSRSSSRSRRHHKRRNHSRSPRRSRHKHRTRSRSASRDRSRQRHWRRSKSHRGHSSRMEDGGYEIIDEAKRRSRSVSPSEKWQHDKFEETLRDRSPSEERRRKMALYEEDEEGDPFEWRIRAGGVYVPLKRHQYIRPKHDKL
eukprot:gb/GECG01003792.1/.p1 GENE.gb/GECG01003792.1/~~gb/GECG01003792.1/.p1  ORF type:complete len:243 (+),score=25.19 gb/GECG01003792.1/:1-729(+)